MWKKRLLRILAAAICRLQTIHEHARRMIEQKNHRKPYRLINTPSAASRVIVHLNGNFAVGGSTQIIVDLIELASDEFRQEVIVPKVPDPLLYEPVDIHSFYVDKMEKFRKYLSDRQPDLVHIHYWSRAENIFDHTGVWYATALRICDDLKLPVVQNINVPTKPMHGRTIRQNVFVSEYVKTEFNDSEVPSTVIYPGSNFSHFRCVESKSRESQDTIGMVYRLDKDKLNERSIEPFIYVAKDRPSTKCIIVGTGMFFDLYQRRVKDEGLAGRFEFTGMASYADLPALYERMGVFVAPVHNESFGQVAPFAMSMGLAVAGYDVGALSEILGSGETLVTSGDEVALGRTIVALLEDENLRSKLGRLNRARAHAMFSREEMVKSYRRIYEKIVNQPSI